MNFLTRGPSALALSLVAALSAAAQDRPPASDRAAKGEVVSELGKSVM